MTIADLRNRGVLQIAATYLVVSWLVLEVGHLLTMILDLPHATMRVVLGMLVLAFPVVVGVFGYTRLTGANTGPDSGEFEIALPESEPAARAEHAAHGGHGGHEGHGAGGVDPLPIIVGVLTIGALILLVVIRALGGGSEPATTETETATATPAPPSAPLAAHRAPADSIAVLPFDNLSGDPSQSYFSDGMSEELRSALAGVRGLEVAARTSSDSFRGSRADITTIAAKLGVAYVLDGSVRRAGTVVRISAQLIDARTGFERWSQSYDRELRDTFAIQSDIARMVTDALKVRLLPQDQARLSAAATASPVAHDAYLRGRQQFDMSGDEAAYRASLAQFDAAVTADPGYALAYAARARTLAALASQFLPEAQVAAANAQSVAAAERAVTLAPNLPEAQAALAYVLAQTRLDIRGARTAYARAVVGGGSDADILIRSGMFDILAGDPNSGVAALNRAVVLDKFNPRAWKTLGLGLFNLRRYAEALPAQREALRLNPEIGSGHSVIGDTLLMMGRLPEARTEYARESQRWARLTGMAIVERKRGDASAADAALTALIAENGDTAIYQQAEVRAQWGDADGALAALDRAFAVTDPGLLFLRQDPLLDPVRKDSRFRAMLARWAAR